VAAVDLTRIENGLAGVVGDEPVDIVVDVPNSRAGIRGESFGARVDGYWRVESNYDTLDPVGLFLGEYDGLPVFLRSAVHLTPHHALRHADISGASSPVPCCISSDRKHANSAIARPMSIGAVFQICL
jgi:hypothetical protein